MLSPVFSSNTLKRALTAPDPQHAAGDYNKRTYTRIVQFVLLILGGVGAGIMEGYKLYHSRQKREVFAQITDYILDLPPDKAGKFNLGNQINSLLDNLPRFQLRIENSPRANVMVAELDSDDRVLGQEFDTRLNLNELKAKLAIDVIQHNFKKNLVCNPAAAKVFFDVIARPELYGADFPAKAKKIVADMVKENYDGYTTYCNQRHGSQLPILAFEEYIFRNIKDQFNKYGFHIDVDQPLTDKSAVINEIRKNITIIATCRAAEAIKPFITKPFPRRQIPSQEQIKMDVSVFYFDKVFINPHAASKIELTHVCDFFKELVKRTPPTVNDLGTRLRVKDYMAIYVSHCRGGVSLKKKTIETIEAIIEFSMARTAPNKIATYFLEIDRPHTVKWMLDRIGARTFNILMECFDIGLVQSMMAQISDQNLKRLAELNDESLIILMNKCQFSKIESMLNQGLTVFEVFEQVKKLPLLDQQPELEHTHFDHKNSPHRSTLLPFETFPELVGSNAATPQITTFAATSAATSQLDVDSNHPQFTWNSPVTAPTTVEQQATITIPFTADPQDAGNVSIRLEKNRKANYHFEPVSE